jgi:hypothetical protein
LSSTITLAKRWLEKSWRRGESKKVLFVLLDFDVDLTVISAHMLLEGLFRVGMDKTDLKVSLSDHDDDYRGGARLMIVITCGLREG